MNTVWIHGSPHPHGDSAALAEAFLARLGGTVTQFCAYDGEILPCVDCGCCAQSARCTRSDRGGALLAAIAAADVIVLSAPVYFSDLPGPLVSMASRMQYLWMRRRAGDEPIPTKTRRGVILLTGGGSGKPDRAIAAAKCYMHMLGIQDPAVIASLKTDQISAREDTLALSSAIALAEEIKITL